MAPLGASKKAAAPAEAEGSEAASPSRPPLKRTDSLGQSLGSTPIVGLNIRNGFSGLHALKYDVVAGAVCCAIMKLLPRIIKNVPAISEASVRRLLYVALGSRVALVAVWEVLARQYRLLTGKWKDDTVLNSCGLTVITTAKWFRIMMFADVAMRLTMTNANVAPDMLVHHLGYYCFAWFGVHMSSRGDNWRDCIISGGWQVLACEMLGAANGLVLVLRPRETALWLRFSSIGSILAVRTPVHASMLYVSSRDRRASLPWRIFSWSAAIFGLILDSRWLKSALLLGNVRAGVD
eukprot:SAG22_NODE_3_length_48349_cov_158.681180_6_plen_293_part_00